MSHSTHSQQKKSGILSALLPGARIDKLTNKIIVHAGTSSETVVFNVGGTRFETYRSTLSAIPSSPLSKDSFLEKYYRPEHHDYFFDRDPAVFHCVLNFFRTGELHLSTVTCGPVVKSELEFWGVDELDIEECCWSRYSSWVSTLQALRKLEDDRNTNTQFGEYPLKDESSRYGRICRVLWKFFIEPTSSVVAQCYAYFSLFVIILSIFSFCAQTHSVFRVQEEVLTLRSPSSSQQSSTSVASSTPSTLSNYSVHNSSHSNTTVGPNGDVYDVEHRDVPHPALYILDQVCLVYFFIELVIRLVVSPAKVRFLTRPITVIEILALLPDIVDGLIRVITTTHYDYEKMTDGLNFLKLLRIMRILRLMRQVPGLWILFYTLRASVADLLLLLMFVSVGMLISASLVYFAERHAQDDFSSIPKCFWWAVITMTTVGYGDMSPVTPWGYLVGSITSIAGVLMVGFAVPVLVNNFIMYYSHTTSTMQRDRQNKSSDGSNYHSASSGGGGFNFSMLGNFGKNVLGSAGGGLDELRAQSRNSKILEMSSDGPREHGGGKDSNDNETSQAEIHDSLEVEARL
ncbi:voltage gated potassium channel [Elysia marginata]|uniref:Voltage gated potassium channel n=1 Tax=Elysia marginata TaxID=1093978 RepID=A0AAV4GPC7_9GAST|nr:voltage gated potassium channel [Elysia marginata]